MNFLKENWIWIAAPIIAVVVLVGIVLMMGEGGEGSMFTYSIF